MPSCSVSFRSSRDRRSNTGRSSFATISGSAITSLTINLVTSLPDDRLWTSPGRGISVIGMTERLARHAALHPKRMLAIWAAIVLLSIAAIGVLLPSAITTDATVTNDPESQQGYDAIFRHMPPSGDDVNEVVLARAPGKDVTTHRQTQLEVAQLAAALQATGRTAQVRSYFDDKDPSLLSPDKDAVLITIGMGPDAEDGIKDVIDVVRQADQGPLEATITGEFTA